MTNWNPGWVESSSSEGYFLTAYSNDEYGFCPMVWAPTNLEAIHSAQRGSSERGLLWPTYLPSTPNFSPWQFLKIYTGNVCKDPQLILLQSKGGFSSANWPLIFGGLQFWFTTCYLSSLSALTTRVPARRHHHLAVVSLLSEDAAASLTLELLVYQKPWQTCRNLPRIEFLM